MAALRTSIARAALQFRPCAGLRSSAARYNTRCSQWQPVVYQRNRLFSASALVREKKYTEDHEWIELSPDGKTCTLGISTYAANALGDVVYIELPEVDLQATEGEAIGAVESVKSASDIMTPVSGKVVDINRVLEEKPATINKDPEGEGWIAKLAVEADAASAANLMSAEEYKKFTEE